MGVMSLATVFAAGCNNKKTADSATDIEITFGVRVWAMNL